MFQTGYSLINENDEEIEFWGNSLGVSVSKPDVLFLPNLHVHDPKLHTDYNGHRLVERYIVAEPPSQWRSVTGEDISYDSENDIVIVTYTYSSEPTITPQTVSPLQMRKALRQLNLKTTVDAYANTVSEEAKESWEYATEIRIDNPFIVEAATALNMTQEQINEIFRLASTL